MSRLKEFLKATIAGGVLFLVPVVLLALLLRRALDVATKVAKPVAEMFPAHAIAGVAIGTIVAAFALLLVAFLAGLAARTETGRKVTAWVSESLLGNMPQYRVVTSMAEGLTKVEQGEGLTPVLLSADGAWQLAYQLEELGNGWVAVFVPQSPTPMSGNVLYVPRARVRAVDIGIHKAMKIVKQIGAGSAEALQGVDLERAPGS